MNTKNNVKSLKKSKLCFTALRAIFWTCWLDFVTVIREVLEYAMLKSDEHIKKIR